MSINWLIRGTIQKKASGKRLLDLLQEVTQGGAEKGRACNSGRGIALNTPVERLVC
jgi:hypothetical protein